MNGVGIFSYHGGKAPSPGEQPRAASYFSNILSFSASSGESLAVLPAPRGNQLSGDGSSTLPLHGSRTKGLKHHTDSSGPSINYKTSWRPLPDIKVKRRAPWGMQQLRD
ncbi:hypothetical protein TraAM80_06740 [Trypanosoma rangeli]|uniref:Uncharacterized protein n=1 Tax=Trypanosoma rangeli TaxID=5698 RepID=A0A422N923_TRYRA|nr:uncharacterized protein TraAM80_06740 [Trypanosoma rangeli]RNF01936.1 hypothetical protein TraAM80_06740 [Trypanosoma rangeli]|eukprot:RNF01936.1 hypothetical protein TraAM80_06740 [Trypanosoma rangeli]